MSKLKVLSSAFAELHMVESVLSCSKVEIINSENTLSFEMPLTDDNKDWINDTNCIGLDGDYFDIAKYKKGQAEDGNLTVSVECEHISYRLNKPDYDEEYFTQTGTPTEILTAILNGTDFTVGTVEFTDSITYSAQEKKSRRGLLVQFAEYLGGELSFSGFSVSILVHRGSITAKDLMQDKNITVISKEVDKTKLDDSGNPTVAYECELIHPMDLALGDVVALDYDKLDINVSLRIVSINTNPYNKYEVSFSVSNTIPTVEDAAYDIATSTVSKNAVYNGCRIGPDNGFEAVLSDNMARAFFNATAFKMQKGDGTGNNWVDVLYFDPTEQTYKFVGKIVIEDGSITWAKLNSDVGDEVTTISKDEISTATIKIKQLTSLGCNPRINLFQDLTVSNGGEPAIDASDGNNNPGDKIRFMWNRYNYIAVEENAIDFYFYYSGVGGTSAICQVRPDGFYVGGHKIGGVDSSTGEYDFTDALGALIRLWVQPENPSSARSSDVWIDTDDYSRYDKTALTADTTLTTDSNEFITADGTFTITLHEATSAGIIKKIYNIGTGIVTIAGTINGHTNMLLYPGESVELVTDGSGWRY